MSKEPEAPGWAFITGANSGIGKAFAQLFARDQVNLILVGRNAKALEQVSTEIIAKYDVQVKILSVNISDEEQLQAAYDKAAGLNVSYLVNSAGFGDRSDLIEAEWDKLHEMIKVNIIALTKLSQLFAQKMSVQKKGHIVNIASIAGLIPGPGMAVYYASKAYVISLGQALSKELENQNVSVTTLCPGATKTNFAHVANAENSPIFKRNLPSASIVAEFGYQAMKDKKVIAIWGRKNRFMAKIVSLLPRKTILKYVQKSQ